MASTSFESLIKMFATMPEIISKEIEKEIKKSAIKVRDDAVNKFGEYQPAVGPYPAWEMLSINTVTQKINHGAEGTQPLIGAYGADKFQEGNKATKNEAWPQPLRNTIGIKVEGLQAAVGTDDPIGKHHEYGAPKKNIPPRPFLRPALYENQDNIKNNVKEGIQNSMKTFIGGELLLIQEEPFQVVCEALASVLKTQVPQLKNAIAGWPESKWLQVDGNLPSIFFVQVSEMPKNVANRLDIHKQITNPDGTGYIVTEQLRLCFLLQISLFTNTPQDRASVGWAIKQYLATNYRIPLSDGEFAMFKLKGDHPSEKGETNFYKRDLTFEVTARILDATPATKVTSIEHNTEID